jgi:hypothetical protein
MNIAALTARGCSYPSEPGDAFHPKGGSLAEGKLDEHQRAALCEVGSRYFRTIGS